MKPAIITIRNNPQGGKLYELRAGLKGKGRLIHTVLGWSNPTSAQGAEQILAEVAARGGFEIVSENSLNEFSQTP